MAPSKPRVSPVRRIIAVVLLLGAAALWFFPSNVVSLIAQQDAVLLGYYSVDRFTVFAVLTGICLYAAGVLAFETKFDRRDKFRTVTVVVSVLVTLVAVDLVGRSMRAARYVSEEALNRTDWPRDRVGGRTRHRPPDVQYNITFADEPDQAKSFPGAGSAPGFAPVDIALTTDHRGFRNSTDLEDYDIVTVGDSFTEGSRVDDSEMWPVLVGAGLGQSVYNLGISGTSPREYLNNFGVHGLNRRPEVAVFMIYEGNDLRLKASGEPLPRVARRKKPDRDRADGSGGSQRRADKPRAQKKKNEPVRRRRSLRDIVKSSPIVLGLKRLSINVLGAINTDAPVADAELLDWIPVPLESAGATRYYAFKPKRVESLYCSEQKYRDSAGWRELRRILELAQATCEEEGIRLVITLAPSKPRVLLPLVREQIPDDKLRAFVALETDDLPDAGTFVTELHERLDAKENVLASFCADSGVDFVSLVGPLRAEMRRGVQVYYTYDQHWTHLGHVVVAETLRDHLSGERSAAAKVP